MFFSWNTKKYFLKAIRIIVIVQKLLDYLMKNSKKKSTIRNVVSITFWTQEWLKPYMQEKMDEFIKKILKDL